MALKINKGLEPYWYTPPSQEKEDNPARFQLAPLTQMQLLEATEDAVYTEEGGMSVTARGAMTALKHGLKKWENVVGDGEVLECNRENFVHLPSVLIRELSNRLIVDAMIGRSTAKNS